MPPCNYIVTKFWTKDWAAALLSEVFQIQLHLKSFVATQLIEMVPNLHLEEASYQAGP